MVAFPAVTRRGCEWKYRGNKKSKKACQVFLFLVLCNCGSQPVLTIASLHLVLGIVCLEGKRVAQKRRGSIEHGVIRIFRICSCGNWETPEPFVVLFCCRENNKKQKSGKMGYPRLTRSVVVQTTLSLPPPFFDHTLAILLYRGAWVPEVALAAMVTFALHVVPPPLSSHPSGLARCGVGVWRAQFTFSQRLFRLQWKIKTIEST